MGLKLPGGTYNFSFRLKVADNTRPEVVAELEVRALRAGGEVVLASREVRATDFREAGVWQVFSLTANVMDDDDVRVAVRFRSGITDLWCDWVRIQPIGPVGEALLDFSPEFWRDSLVEPVRIRRRSWVRGLEFGGVGSVERPLRAEGPGHVEIGPRKGLKLRLEGPRALLLGPDGSSPIRVGPEELRLELPGLRRLVMDSMSLRFEGYDGGSGSWRELASAELIWGWRDEEEPDKIAMRALRNYPFGPTDLDVPGLDGQGRLVLREVGVKASSLDALAEERRWGQALLVLSSSEISDDGTIRPGAIDVAKIAPDVGVKSDLFSRWTNDLYSTSLPGYTMVESFYVKCQSDMKNVLEGASCELRVEHGDGLGRAWCKTTVQIEDGPEEVYSEWSTEETEFVKFSKEEEVHGGDGEALRIRFYLMVENVQSPPPGGELPKAFMRKPRAWGRRYARRLEVP